MRSKLLTTYSGAAIALIAVSLPASAQTDSVTVIPGQQYEARNSLHESLLGKRYRNLWTTPITVPVLDLSTYAGGLTPVSRGGHLQTMALRFAAKDGREFNFRSVDKELTPAMPDFTKETIADWIRQDQTSAQLPAGPIVASTLLDAVGVLNPGPRLMVMPDDPRLGEFRDEFAGLLGTLEVHADEGPDDSRLFADAEVVAGTERLLEHLYEDLDDRVNSRAFLKARLMDVLIGDWDRHEGQWRWARYDRDNLRWWVPVPEDRDYAFVNYDGLLLELTRRFGIIRMVEFGRDYSDLLAMVDNSLELTQRFVGDLPYEAWDSTAIELQTALTDDVIRAAVETMPPPHVELIGDELTTILQERRDRLREIARDFFLLLNQAAEVHGTEHGDELLVERRPDGTVEFTLLVGGDPDYPPRFQRVFMPDETEEVRVYLYEGDDRVQVTGTGTEIIVRVISGEGDDHLEDRSSGPTAFYDASGDNTFIRGAETSVDQRTLPEGFNGDTPGSQDAAEEDDEESEGDDANLLPRLPRDWGQSVSAFSPTVDWRSAAELVIGGGPTYTGYGFRHRPYATRLELTGLYAPLHTRFELQARADLRREGSYKWFEIVGIASDMNATLFRGFGNDSPDLSSDASRVWHDRLRLEATYHLPNGRSWGTFVGALVDYTNPQPEPGTPAASLPPSDTDGLGRLGAYAGLRIDTSDDAIFPRSGFRARLSGTAYPPAWDLAEPLGKADLLTTAYIPVSAGFNSVLALRAGGSAAFGDYPFYDAAFLGGSRSLRGHGFQRFAGDQAVFGGAELRVPITDALVVVRGTLGASVFADVGRVYVDRESPGGWHSGVGGGAWFAIPIGVLNVSYAHGEDDRFYVHLGVPF